MAERKIAGKTFKVEPLPARDAIELYADLMRVVGQGTGRIPAILMGLTSEDEGANYLADVAAIGALADVLSKTTSVEVSDLIERIVGCAMILQPSKTYRQADLNGDFTGSLKDLLPVMKFVLEVQYRDFFTASAGGGVLRVMMDAFQTSKLNG